MNKVILTTASPKKPRYIQLGLYNLKAYIQKHDRLKKNISIDIDIINSEYSYEEEDYWPSLNRKTLLSTTTHFLKSNPKIIGFSCFSWNINLILKLAKIIKKKNSKIIIILGGPEVSIDSERILKKNKCINMIVRDEGEETFLDILRSVFLKELNLEEIKGLSFRSGNKIIRNPLREPLSLDKIPSPYLEGLIDTSQDTIMTIETSRGCYFRCAYCSYSIQNNGILRFFPLKRTKEELRYLLNKKVTEIWINDDNFNIHPVRAKEILKYIIKYKRNTSLGAFINASMWKIDDLLVQLFKKAKFNCAIGIQTINPKALTLINRKNNLPILEENLRNLDKNKITYFLQFISALPGDTYQDVEKSVNWASKFKAHMIQLHPLELMKGTVLYNEAKSYGLRNTGKQFQYHLFVIQTRDMSNEDIQALSTLSKILQLIYNYRFLRSITRYLIENYSVNIIDIIREWQKEVKIMMKDKKYLISVQRSFAKHLFLKYRVKLNKVKMEKMLNEDINYYFSSYYDSSKFLL